MTTIVYYDLETTGLDTRTAEIVQLAAAYDNDKTFDALVCPAHAIPVEASAIHGISIEDVQDKPAFAQVIADFFAWLPPNALLVAHNNFGYDQLILERQCRESSVAIPPGIRFGDSLPVLRELFWTPEHRSFALHKLNARWVPKELRVTQTHRALDDVKMLMLVLKHCPEPEETFARIVQTQSNRHAE